MIAFSKVTASRQIWGEQPMPLKLLYLIAKLSKVRQATSGSFSQPAMRTNSMQNSVINNGVKIWNNIPKDIRLCKSKFTFKKFLKLWLLENDS